jgi:hypothetical protein
MTGLDSRAPVVLRGPAEPAGMVRVSVAVGMNGAVASKVKEARPTFLQVPRTGGEKVGVPTAPVIGWDIVTVTTWSDGTWPAPWAGTVAATVNGATGTAVVVGPPPAAAGVEPLP